MNYDEVYDIRQGKYEDIPMVMDFIDKHWKKSHILSRNRDFFEYEFLDGETLHFILSIHKETGELHGIQGFLYSSNRLEQPDIWGVVWKVRDDVPTLPFLGIELKKRACALTGSRCELGVGVNPKTALPLEKLLLKYDTKKMNHFYLLSPREEYHIAKVSQYRPVAESVLPQYQVKPLTQITDIEKVFDFDAVTSIPSKDSWYVNHRYLTHPIYTYEVCGIFDSSHCCGALMVLREEAVGEVKVLRIIDYIGNHRLFSGLQSYFETRWKDYEYIDFYCAGFEDEEIIKAGFSLRDDTDSNIIPDYFHPFLQENIEIWVSSSQKDCTFFKGDGDQDRPNE